MRAMIFAAGLGTRLRPLTDTMPKALVPVGGKPLLQWQIEMLRETGIRCMVVNVHHLGEQIIGFLDAHDRFGCDIEVSDERERLLDTGGGLRKVMRDHPGVESWLALNVDILSTIRLPELTGAFDGVHDLARLVVSHRQTSRYLLFDDELSLCGWTNTATGAVRPDGLVTAGLQPLAFSGMQVVSPHLLPYMEQMEGDVFSMIDVYMHVLEHTEQGADHSGRRLRGFVPDRYEMRDIGKIDQFSEVEQWVRRCF